MATALLADALWNLIHPVVTSGNCWGLESGSDIHLDGAGAFRARRHQHNDDLACVFESMAGLV
jgi:hypothetical protein